MKITELAVALAALIALVPPAPTQAQTESGTPLISACYVPGPGLLYRTGIDGQSSECRSADDIPLSWNAAVDVGTIQVAVATACSPGSAMRAISADGTPLCEPDDDSAEGVDFAAFQSRVAAACPEGAAIRSVTPDGQVECHADQSAAVSTLQVRVTEACPAGSSVRVIDQHGNVQCQIDRVSTFSLGREFSVSRSDDSGTSSVSMGSTFGTVCFLTEVEFEDLDAGGPGINETGSCATRIADGAWQLEASVSQTDDANAWCSARCITWHNQGSAP